MILDLLEEDPDCQPWEVFYYTGFGVPGGVDGMTTACDFINQSNGKCAQQSCKVEGMFIHELLTEYLVMENDYFIAEELKHDNGFDQANTCVAEHLYRG